MRGTLEGNKYSLYGKTLTDRITDNNKKWVHTIYYRQWDDRFHKMRKYMSAVHLLQSISIMYAEFVKDILDEKNLFAQEIKMNYKALEKAFDKYNNAIVKTIGDEQLKDFCHEFEELEEIISNFTQLNEPASDKEKALFWGQVNEEYKKEIKK